MDENQVEGTEEAVVEEVATDTETETAEADSAE